MIKKIAIITLACSVLTVLVDAQQDKALATPAVDSPVRVTIWVHGTRLNPYFPFNLIKSLVNFDVHLNTPLAGLHLVSDCPPDNHMVTIARTLNDADPAQFPLEHFYTFGWSGKLDHATRLAAGIALKDAIENQIIKPALAQSGQAPIITIITHSHGGNVALNMAQDKRIPFVVDRLILLACPVQALTFKHIQSPLFKKVYSLFSHNDIMQVLDPQIIPVLHKSITKARTKKSFNPIKKLWNGPSHLCLFSERRFTEQPKLTQIKVSWDVSKPWDDADLSIYGDLKSIVQKMSIFDFFKKRGLTHIEFLIPSFLRQLPAIINHPFVIKELCSFAL